jgi:hypothetical protein
VSGLRGVGGIAGYFQDGNITDCYFTGNVTATLNYAGGITGWGWSCCIINCYSTGSVKGYDKVGGIAGQVNDGCIKNCAALNSEVIADDETTLGRVVGLLLMSAEIDNNIAFEEMLQGSWNYIGHDDLDGESVSKETINADGTLGDRFTAPIWTTENGKLPGLNGNTVEMPEYLLYVGIAETYCNTSLQVYPNPTTGELRIKNYELGMSNVEIFDMMGKIVYQINKLTNQQQITKSTNNQITNELTMDVSHLPNGVYFIYIKTQNNLIIKKIIKL